MKKKAGFTLVEMFAVIIILGILAAIGIGRLSTKNADKYKAEMCVNQIYGILSEFIHQIIRYQIPKGVNKEMDYYYLQYVNNGYISYGEYNTYKEIAIGINDQYTPTPNTCLSDKFLINTIPRNFNSEEYSSFKLQILPGFKGKGNTPSIWVEGATDLKPILKIPLRFCDKKAFEEENMNMEGLSEIGLSNICEDFAEIQLDTRTGLLRKSFCQLYETDDPNTQENEGTTCKQRSL